MTRRLAPVAGIVLTLGLLQGFFMSTEPSDACFRAIFADNESILCAYWYRATWR